MSLDFVYPLLLVLPPAWRDPFVSLVVPGVAALALAVSAVWLLLRLVRYVVWGRFHLPGRVVLITGAGTCLTVACGGLGRRVARPVEPLLGTRVTWKHAQCGLPCAVGVQSLTPSVDCGCTHPGAGIGRELAIQFAGAGCTVVLVDIRPTLLQAVRKELATRHGVDPAQVLAWCCDVSDRQAVASMAKQVQEAVAPRHVSVVVNNAGAAAVCWPLPVRCADATRT